MAGVSDLLDRPASAGDAPPAPGRLPHVGGLDGLRGLAVIGVLCFHGGFGWARGGYLGVSLFFTLSGYLITNLLVAERGTSGHIDLGRFWSRRIRRLLPASLLTIAGIAVYGWLVASDVERFDLRGDLLGALLYVANWRFLTGGTSYADVQGGGSLVLHFWSLAIEEQFYVLWPILAAVVLARWGRRHLGAVIAVLLGASVALCVVWWDGSAGAADKIYFATPTRAAELLVGAALALLVPIHGRPARPGISARVLPIAGLLATGALLAMWVSTEQGDAWQYQGGYAAHALVAAVAIAAVVRPGPLGRLLSFGPLRLVGVVSYGLYLYHWPVFVVVDAERLDLAPVPLFAVRLAITAVLAAASYRFIEEPVRRGTWFPGRRIWVAAPVGMAIVAALVLWSTRNPPELAFADFDPDDAEVAIVTAPPSPSITTAPVEPTAPGPTGPTSEPPPVVPAPAAVMTIGDSGMYDATPALRATFAATGTGASIESAFPGLRLTGDEVAFDWRREWARTVADQRPDLTIVMIGGFDEAFLEAEGPDAYAAVTDEAVEILTASGGRVLWLSVLPCGRDSSALDAVFATLPERHPGQVAYLDTAPVFPGCVTTEVDAAGRTVPLRKPDGWHLCPAGAERFARHVHREAARLGWAPPPAVGWEDGPWRQEPRYDDPPDGCDTR